jgi:hypothetical protein
VAHGGLPPPFPLAKLKSFKGTQTMNHFTDDIQIEEAISFGFYDDEETQREIESYYDEEYDDLTAGIPLDSTNDF